MKIKAFACWILISILQSVVTTGLPALEMTVSHDLGIVLLPEKAELEGRDRIRIQKPPNGPIDLFLSPRARVRKISLNGQNHPYRFDRGRLSVNLNQHHANPVVDLSIHYSCRFDDPAPVQPVNTDNPGLGVSGTISTQGTFILSGAGWYPRMANARETFDLRVDGPVDTVAVTTGRPLGITREDGRTISRWRIDNPLEGLSLSAGPYVVEQKTQNGFTAATYLFPENQALSRLYLETTLDYLKRYSNLFGAYPFGTFAVVENFFPTGYGFPAYTLMGGMVLRLPFIPQTSLPHEIAHSWWGNGVLVDFASGNWCEGLTTYVADYLNSEQRSNAAALDHRRQALRNYASLVSEATDFPLNRFQGRTDPATKTVGYDKSAMVFHMLRQELGDASFWSALKDLYDQFLFKRASWQDLRHVFENHSDRSLAFFFSQWVDRAGAPQLRLENIRRIADGGGYRTNGHLVQDEPYYDLALKLVVNTTGSAIERTVRLTGRQMAFEIPSTDKPLAIVADPQYHLFRRLTPEELPATINTLKGSPSVELVIADRLGRVGTPTARRFAQALGVEPVRTMAEADFSPTDLTGNNLLFIGLPEQAHRVKWFPHEWELGANFFQLAGQRFDQSTDVLFCVARHPDDPGKVVALLHPLSAEAVDAVISKIPHYGRYSYLAFSDGQNRSKGTWDVKTSPMAVNFNELAESRLSD